MPLWGVDRWVPLGDLFVDVNILEKLSSSRMSELDDLWQDFSNNPSYRSLDRIGLGREQATGVRLRGGGEEYKPDGGGQTGFGKNHVFATSGDGVQCRKITSAPDSGFD
jgi:hypothetical protein